MTLQTRPADESVIIPQSEVDFALGRRAAGKRVIESNGRFWLRTHPGFFQPIHWLARLPASQVRCPVKFCSGYRANLTKEDAAKANGCMPVHLLGDISRYTAESLHQSRRYDLKKSRKLVTVVELTGLELLESEGYDVLRSSRERTGYAAVPTKAEYQAAIRRPDVVHTLTLAGLVNGKLGGYLQGYAIDQAAYIHSVFLATEALPTQIGTALIFNFVQVCKRSCGIQEVVYGPHSREDAKLVAYKERMGFPVVQLPSIVHINPFVKLALRVYKPHACYRLTGS